MTGPQLRIIRECAGLSQLKLAQMIGTSQTWISRFERGLSIIPEEIAEKVAMALPKATLEAQTAKTEEIRARERWQKKTDAYLEAQRQRRKSREDGGTAKESLTVPPPVEVRMCSTVELGPETMKAIKDMIETAIRELAEQKAPVTIRPEVIQAAKEGDRYRERTQAVLNGRGW